MRVNSFEFGDLQAVPAFYHQFLREFMSKIYLVFGIHKLWRTEITEFVKRQGSQSIHDPCAGSGYVNQLIFESLDEKLNAKFYLSDLMTDESPEFAKQINALGFENLKFAEKSIDLLKIEASNQMPKMFVNSFHHFDRDHVKEILKNTLGQGKELLVLEYCRKTPDSLMSMLFGGVFSLLFFPFVVEKKFVLPSFIFTYLIPVIPFMLVWDGVVSCLRTHSSSSLEEILVDLNFSNVSIEKKTKRSLLYPSGVDSYFFKIENRK
ncbi:MAG: class I SAM-dependent methyltransferase [Bdellovibrionota bacterium]|nr:class I SAM-dependent methyltransferase [Bdellovibrionota bacterium]